MSERELADWLRSLRDPSAGQQQSDRLERERTARRGEYVNRNLSVHHTLESRY